MHPQTLAVLRTRAEPLGWNLIVGDPLTDLDKADVFGALLQYPGTSGAVRDLRPAIAALHAKGALAVVAADLLALTLLASPGELGADIAVGSAQRFGVPMGYGGPHAAYMAVRDALKRSLPGRIVGLSVDSRGRAGLSAGAADPRAAYPPREGDLQHLHRAGAAGGDRLDVRGLSRPRGPDAHRAQRAPPRRGAGGGTAQARLCAAAATASSTRITVDAGAKQDEIVARARAEKINLRIGDGTLGIALDETTTPAIVEAVWRAFGGKLAYADDRSRRARGAAGRAEARAPPSSPIRCSTPIAPRPRCCATCASSAIATSRSTAR